VRAKSWVKELQRQASPNIVIALAGNKSDLADKRLVETEVCCSNCTFSVLKVFAVSLLWILLSAGSCLLLLNL